MPFVSKTNKNNSDVSADIVGMNGVFHWVFHKIIINHVLSKSPNAQNHTVQLKESAYNEEERLGTPTFPLSN